MRFITIMLASVAIAATAYAGDDKSCSGIGNCTDNDTYNTTNKGGTGIGVGIGEGGDATAVNFNANVAKGGDVKIERGAFDIDQHQKVDVDTRVHQDQDQHQRQEQSARSSSRSSVSGSGNSSNYIDASTHNPREVASAATIYAAPSPIVCSMPRGASAQGLTFGAALSFGDNDNECDTRAAAAMFYAQNNSAMGNAIMCTLDTVAEAAKRLADAGQENACFAVTK